MAREHNDEELRIAPGCAIGQDVQRLLNEKHKLLEAARLVAPACDSLMAEATGHGVTDWGKVNDMLCAIKNAVSVAEIHSR